MLAQNQIPLRSCGRARLSDRYTRRRMMACPRVAMRGPRPDMNYIGDRIPFAVKLADLLGIHIENNRDLMISLTPLCMHHWQIETAARSGIQDAHQCSLRIAVADVKALHVIVPLLLCRFWFFFQQHLRQRCARRNHRINVGLGRAIEHQQLRIR